MAMHFTVIFQTGDDGPPPTYHLVYHPSAMWTKDGEEIYTMRNPHYESGLFDGLLKSVSIRPSAMETKEVIIVAHSGGHGERKDLFELQRDIESFGFRVSILHS